jgi:hypothetical protein
MKYLIFVLLLASCSHEKQRNMTLFMRNGQGLDLSTGYINVDSVTTTTPTSATIWIDGTKTVIYAERIMITN